MIMKRFILPIAALALTFGLTACNDDDEKVWVVDDPTIEINETGTSYNTLTFEWDALEGVNQYGYELSDPEGTIVARGVTDDTMVIFDELMPSTTYTLTVYAYGPDGTTTRRFTLTGTTKTLVKLSAPELSATQTGARIYVTWNAVPDAGYYHYSYLLNNEEITGDTNDTTLELVGIPVGEYTISVMTVADGEGFESSETSNCNFSRNRNEMWSVTGDYISSILSSGNSWKVTMTAYDDGSYVLNDWYGVKGYNMEFTVNEDYSLNIETDVTDSYGYYLVPSGKSQVPEVNIWPFSGYSAFDGGQEYGMLWFYATDGGNSYGYDTFEWGNDEPDVPTLDVSGTYCISEWSGYESYWFSDSYDWNPFAYSNFDVTVTQNGNDITMTGFMGFEEGIKGTLDPEARTITFPAQDIDVNGYTYRFALERDDLFDYLDLSVASDPVVATIDESFNLDISGWSLYYVYNDGGVFAYFTSVIELMTRY